jgi:hypothetical protein
LYADPQAIPGLIAQGARVAAVNSLGRVLAVRTGSGLSTSRDGDGEGVRFGGEVLDRHELQIG